MKNSGRLLIVPMLLLSLVLVTACDVVGDIIDDAASGTPTTPQQTTPPETTTPPDTTVTGPVAIPMDFDHWVKVNTGDWEKNADGIKVYGAGVREGHQGLISKAMYDFRDSETRVKWQANGGGLGVYSAFWVFMLSDYVLDTGGYSTGMRGGYFTTDHSWKESVVIPPDTWHYTRVMVAADGSYTAVTATGGYDDAGGNVIYEGSGEYEGAANGNLLVIFNDNYGGTDTFIVVVEALTSASPTGDMVTIDPPQTQEPQDDGLKTIIVYPQPGVTNASVNGFTVVAGTENRVQIDANQPLVATYTFVNSQGNTTETMQTLDTYYEFHVLKANGGWASTIHRGAFETDKTSG